MAKVTMINETTKEIRSFFPTGEQVVLVITGEIDVPVSIQRLMSKYTHTRHRLTLV